MKKRISLSRMTVLIQAILFAVVAGLIILVGIYFQMQTREEAAASAQTELQTIIRDLDSRLDAAGIQVREVLRVAVASNGLWSGDSASRYFEKVNLRNVISNKSLFYEDMALLFVCRKDDFYLGNITNQTGTEKLAYRDYIMQNIEEMAEASNGNLWIIRDVDGIDYCFLVYAYANEELYVGVGLRCEELFDELDTFFQSGQGWMTVTDSEGTEYADVSSAGQDRGLPEGIEVQESTATAGLSIAGSITVSALKFWQKSTSVSILLLILLCVCSIMVQYRILRRVVVNPVMELADAVKNTAEDGGGIEEIKITESAFTQEIYTLQKALNYLLGEVISARLLLYEKKVQEQDTELRLLRAQLRPHFYLNSLMTVNSMTYQNRNEDIRKYLGCFSDYMRYMMRINTSMVCLKEELTHIQNYIDMQEIKFPSSVVSMIECPRELADAQIPHLILYTIVENAFKYAMNLQDTLILLISCGFLYTGDFTGYQVIVEDNGKGFDEETLKLYNGEGILEDKEGRHIGLSNVKRSLFLQYDRKDLLRLSNTLSHGARIEVRIPKEEKEWV